MQSVLPVGCNVTCHPACTDKLLNTCVPAINTDMPPLAKRRRKGNDKQPKDHASSENEKSGDATEHPPIAVDLDKSMDNEQPSAKKQQNGDKGSPVTSRKSSKQQKSSKKGRKSGETAEQDAGSMDMTDADLSGTSVQPPAKKQRKDKKGQGSEAKQSRKSLNTDTEHAHVEEVRVHIKKEEEWEGEDVASLLYFAPEGQVIKMEKVTSLW